MPMMSLEIKANLAYLKSMTDIQKPIDQTAKGQKITEAQKREERLAAAMRENLKKRKAAARKASQKDRG